MDDTLEHARGLSSAKGMYDSICDVFQGHTLLNELRARRDFYIVEMKPREKILPFINRVQ